MMIHSLTQEIKETVEAMASHRAYAKVMQPVLRRFVIDRDFPLVSRFQVWSMFCIKEERAFVIGADEFGIVGNMVRNLIPNDYDRYRTYTWEDFLGYVEDELEDGEDEWIMLGTVVTLDRFKEELMETNFGSFYNDW